MHNYSWLKHYHHLLNPNAVTDRMILFLCGTQNNFFLIQQQWMVRTSFRKKLFKPELNKGLGCLSILCKAPSVWGWFSFPIKLWNSAVFVFSFLLFISSVKPSHIELTDSYNSDLADCSVGLWKWIKKSKLRSFINFRVIVLVNISKTWSSLKVEMKTPASYFHITETPFSSEPLKSHPLFTRIPNNLILLAYITNNSYSV